MSMDACKECGRFIDTDDEPGCYVGNDCICEVCQFDMLESGELIEVDEQILRATA